MRRTITLGFLLCSCACASVADTYTSPTSANSPPTTYQNDPATTNNSYPPEAVITPEPSNTQRVPNPAADDVSTTPNQPS